MILSMEATDQIVHFRGPHILACEQARGHPFSPTVWLASIWTPRGAERIRIARRNQIVWLSHPAANQPCFMKSDLKRCENALDCENLMRWEQELDTANEAQVKVEAKATSHRAPRAER